MAPSCAVAMLATGATALADVKTPLKPPRVYAGIHQPSGRPTKASGFAPRPGGSKRHVYGAPIQSPIFKMQPKKPASSLAPKTGF
jgi:hypothetical protein